MLTKKNASFIVTIALSMVILAYISYVAVYKQILSKSNGFFNVILFGVVLILVFIFITLLARIITINPDSKDSSPVLRILIIVGILAIFAIFVYSRLQYKSSVPFGESTVYKSSVAITNGTLPQLKDVHDKLVSYPGDFSYSIIMSLIFGIFESSGIIFTYVNIFMMLVASAFLFLTVNLISGKPCAVFAVVFFMFIPNNSFLVYSYNSELFCTANFMIALYLYELMIYRRFKSNSASIVISVLCGLFSGLAICSEPVLILVFIALMIWALKVKRQSNIACALPQIISIVLMLIISFVKSLVSSIGFFEILKGFALCFVPTVIREAGSEFSFIDMLDGIKERFNDPSRFMKDNFYSLTKKDGNPFSNNQSVWLDIANQIIYIFMLILCVMCVVYILRVYYDKIMPLFSALIAVFVGQVLGGSNKVGYVYVTALIMIIGSSTLYYMYMNHHNDYAVLIINEEIAKDEAIRKEKLGEQSDETGDNLDNADSSEDNVLDEEYLRRARALIFVGEDEQYYNEIKIQEKQERINNPYAATRIKTTLNEEGVYDSVEENLEFYDELDAKPELNKPVYEVKAIPSTRPVEIVKPVLADDYYEETSNNVNSFAEIPVATPVTTPVVTPVDTPVVTPVATPVVPSMATEYTSAPTSYDYKSDNDYNLNSQVAGPTYVDNTELVHNVQSEISTPMYENRTEIVHNSQPQVSIPTYDIQPVVTDNHNPQFEGVNDYIPQPEVTNDYSPQPNLPQDNGFVFRNRGKEVTNEAPVVLDKKALKAQQKEAEKQAKLAAKEAEKQAKLAAKQAKKGIYVEQDTQFMDEYPGQIGMNPMDVAPGKPLPNPMPLPKPHVSKSLDYDYDYDVKPNDDYDY